MQSCFSKGQDIYYQICLLYKKCNLRLSFNKPIKKIRFLGVLLKLSQHIKGLPTFIQVFTQLNVLSKCWQPLLQFLIAPFFI
jgi:hypothetical protein